ncbi:hypothetical protein K488DRAFT_15245, partial [Vararia minispora EC-137]
MLQKLPVEIILQVLSHAPLSVLANLLSVSQAWSALINQYEAAIYRRAAYLHALIDTPEKSLEEAVAHLHGDFWEDVPVVSWKELCPSLFPSRIIRAAGDEVHRIKADERARICIVSHSRNGLTVTNLGSPGGPSQVLWSLSPRYVRRYAHVEYENGFLIFDRISGSKEVWRLRSTLPKDGPLEAPQSPPDENMRIISTHSAYKHRATNPRGHFVPWALLRVPDMTRAYHYVHPTLATVSTQTVFLYDVPTGTRTHFPIFSDEIRYVELNDAFVFVCGSDCVRVYARQGGAKVLEIPASTTAVRVA